MATNFEQRCSTGRACAHLLAGVLVALFPFIAILFLGVPSWIPSWLVLDTVTRGWAGEPWGGWSLALRLLWSLLVVCGVVYLLHFRGWKGRWLPLALMLAGLAIPQACIWSTAQSKYTMIAGLLPFSDASGYLDYAIQMLENHRIAGGFTDRPMFSALLSSVLQFTGMDLQVALAVMLAFCGIGMFLAVREMHARFGVVAATVFLFILYVYYNRSIGTLMTEHLGLGLSLYAFPLLMRGLMEPRRGLWLTGSLFLSAALVARAGAFFVLPGLAIIAGRHFRAKGCFSVPSFALAIVVMLVPFALNRLLIERLFDPATRPQSNFALVAYGVLRGTTWTDALNTYGMDYPKIRAATIEMIREKPHRVLHAMRRTWRQFFPGAYGFIFTGIAVSRALIAAFIFAFILGLLRSTRGPYDGFSVMVALAILMSIPFVPPADCDHMRAYAATMPLQACLAASGLAAFVSLVSSAVRRRRPFFPLPVRKETIIHGDSSAAITLGGLMAGLTLIVPLVREALSRNDPSFDGIGRTGIPLEKYESSAAGLSGTGANRSVRIPMSFAVHVIHADEGKTRVPEVRINDLHERLAGFGSVFVKEGDVLAALPAGVSLVHGGMLRLLVVPTAKLMKPGSRGEFTTVRIGYYTVSYDSELDLPELSADAPRP